MYPKNHTGTILQLMYPKNHTGTILQIMYPKNHTGTILQLMYPKNHTGTILQIMYPKNLTGTILQKCILRYISTMLTLIIHSFAFLFKQLQIAFPPTQKKPYFKC
jgi:hypothetical protein